MYHCLSPSVSVMYGLLIEGVCEALKERFGAEKWNEIREWAGVTQHAFVTHDRYSEAIVQRIARATTELTDMQMTQVMELCGMAFVDLLSRYVIVLVQVEFLFSNFLSNLFMFTFENSQVSTSSSCAKTNR